MFFISAITKVLCVLPILSTGIRIGTSAVTSRGLKESDVEKIVTLIDSVIVNPEDETGLKNVHQQVLHMMEEKPLYK